MHEINFTDRSFDKDSTGIYSISIQADQQGLTYCIFDNKTGCYVLFRKYRFEHIHLVGDLIGKIAGVLEKDDVVNLHFNSVRFLAYTQQSTLVPDEYFDSNKIHDYLMFNHAGDIDHGLFNNIITPDIHNVFALPRDLVSLITLHFKKVVFMNQTTPFLRHVTSIKNPLKPAMYIGLHAGFFDVACMGSGQLKLYNTFQYVNESDLLYYVVFVCNQLGFDTRKIPLYLSGEHGSKLSYYNILKQYLPETKYDDALDISLMAPGLKQIDTYKFLNLLNLKMCASSAEHTGVRKIAVSREFDSRPLQTDFAREALFNIMANHFDFENIRVLDLFSGTGSISFEFASRGCCEIDLVDINSRSIQFINKVANDLGIKGIHSVRMEVSRFLSICRKQYHLIFADPPYDMKSLQEIPEKVLEHHLLLPGGWFVLEHGKSRNFKSHPQFFDERNYGSVHFSFFR